MVLAKPCEGRGPTKGAENWKSLDSLPHLCTPEGVGGVMCGGGGEGEAGGWVAGKQCQ
jgi:hypothetical protein